MDLLERVTATQKTIDAFFEKPFVWGTADCGVLASTHLNHMGFTTRLSEVAGYTNEGGAKRALVKLGVRGMDDLADAQFETISPASCLSGDLVGFPGGEEDDQWTALGIAIGNGFIIGFANGECQRGPIGVCTKAWRVA